MDKEKQIKIKRKKGKTKMIWKEKWTKINSTFKKKKENIIEKEENKNEMQKERVTKINSKSHKF